MLYQYICNQVLCSSEDMYLSETLKFFVLNFSYFFIMWLYISFIRLVPRQILTRMVQHSTHTPYQHHYYQVQDASMESTELKPHYLELELVAVESWIHCRFSEVDYQKSLYSQCLLHL